MNASEHAERFTGLRPLLFTIAYEILGSATESDDVLQESYLRWAEVDLAVVKATNTREESVPTPWIWFLLMICLVLVALSASSALMARYQYKQLKQANESAVQYRWRARITARVSRTD